MGFAEVALKQAALWFDNSTDEEVLKVLGPGLLNLFERIKLSPERRRRAVRLLQLGLDQVKQKVDTTEPAG